MARISACRRCTLLSQSPRSPALPRQSCRTGTWRSFISRPSPGPRRSWASPGSMRPSSACPSGRARGEPSTDCLCKWSDEGISFLVTLSGRSTTGSRSVSAQRPSSRTASSGTCRLAATPCRRVDCSALGEVDINGDRHRIARRKCFSQRFVEQPIEVGDCRARWLVWLLPGADRHGTTLLQCLPHVVSRSRSPRRAGSIRPRAPFCRALEKSRCKRSQ